MTRIKRDFISFFKSRKVNIFLLFVLLALLFSILTKLSREYTQIVTFQIQATNVPEDKIIIKDSVHKLDISLSTYGFKLIKYYLSVPSVNIDMSNLDKNENYFIWTEKKEFSNIVSQFEPNVKILKINPDTLIFRYDTDAVKKVPVVLNTNIEYSPGYDLIDNYKLEPDSVKIIGPAVLIDSISFIETNELILKNVNTNISSLIDLNVPKNDQLRFSNQNILIKAEVEKFTEGIIDVPVIIRNVPDDVELKIYPKIIQVVFYTSLSEFNNIASNSFIVECDYNEALQSNNSFLIPRIMQQPEHVKSARLNIKRIEFIITK